MQDLLDDNRLLKNGRDYDLEGSNYITFNDEDTFKDFKATLEDADIEIIDSGEL